MGLLFVFAFLLPICIGMVVAFFGGRAAGRAGSETSVGVWAGYGEGLRMSIFVFAGEMALIALAVAINDYRHILGAVSVVIVPTLIFVLFTMFIGLVLYTAPAFFGYGIGKQRYVSELIEKEANRTQEEIENDIRRKQSLRTPLR